MAISKKGARNITVNEQPYIWRAKSGNDGGFNITVSAKHGNGQLLTAYVDIINDPEGVLIITAYIIRQMILVGLENNWTPDEKKAPLALHRINEKIDLEKATYLNRKSNSITRP